MNSLIYLVRTEIKNSLKELLHKPGKLVLYILVVAGIVGLIFLSAFTQQAAEGRAPMVWLKGIYFAFLLLFFTIAIQKGLTSGDTIFEMSDVNLLFCSPLNPRSILLYGLIRLTKTSFFAGFFILFQSSSLANFGVEFGGLLLILFTFMLNTVALSILSLVIYSVTNGNRRRKMLVRVLAVLIFAPLAVYFALQYLALQNPVAALTAVLDSPFLNAIPFVGWTSAGTISLLQGGVAAGLFWLGLVVLAAGGMIVYIMLSRADYYEDVLVATETAYERKRAAEEGDVQAVASAGTAKVNVSKTGIQGAGASAIFYKHLRETFRQNRLGFFSLSSIITGAAMMGAAVFLRGMVDISLPLQILMWMQIFMIGNGRGLRELYTHYIYLIPEAPFKKVVYSNLELVFKTLIESVFFLGIPGLILGDNPLVYLASMLVYTLFSFLLLGINYFSMRFSDANLSAGILVVIYMLAVLLVMAPGLVPAMIVGFSVGGMWGLLAGLLILSAWELLAGAVCFALSKSVLHNCDMPSMKPSGK